jgi:hypothetical protein
MKGWKKTITKADMLESVSGFIFAFDTSDAIGLISVLTTWYYQDSDVPGAIRSETDRQYICASVALPLPNCITIPQDTNDHDVTFTRLETSDIAEKYSRMVDVYDRPILTSDGEYILVLRTE